MSGWIKLYRDIFKNPVLCKPAPYIVWSYILCNVVHKPEDVMYEGKRITLRPGQGLFKFKQIAKEIDVPATTIHRIIKTLKNESQIETQTSPRNTLVTVLNWEKYQGDGTQNGTQVEPKWNPSGTQTEPFPIIKRIKEVKNEKKRERHKHGTYQNVLLSDEDLQKLQTELPDWQRRIDRLSEYMASTGKTYKDHLATIRVWARKDEERGNNMGGSATGTESEIARVQDAIRRAQEEQRAATVGTVPAGGSIPDQGVRTGRSGKPPV